MDTSTIEYDSENDYANDESATQPLLMQSASSQTSQETNRSTTTIKLPTLANQHKSNAAKIVPENRVLYKLGHILNNRFNRNEYRRTHRDKWSRINIGLLTISFLSVVYLCVSLNLNVDKPSPQLIVDVPPIDVDLVGQTGNISFSLDFSGSLHGHLILLLNYGKIVLMKNDKSRNGSRLPAFCNNSIDKMNASCFNWNKINWLSG